VCVCVCARALLCVCCMCHLARKIKIHQLQVWHLVLGVLNVVANDNVQASCEFF